VETGNWNLGNRQDDFLLSGIKSPRLIQAKIKNPAGQLVDEGLLFPKPINVPCRKRKIPEKKSRGSFF